MVADEAADAARFREVVFHSLDRKVCNTLNVCVILRSRAAELVPVFLESLEAAGRRRRGCRLHVARGAEAFLPRAGWVGETVEVVRAEGVSREPRADLIPEADLAREWEWEETPEVSLALADDLADAIALFNRFAPRLVATLVTSDPDALHPVGRRPVRPGPARAWPFQLGGRPALRPGRGLGRGRRLHRPDPDAPGGYDT
jgi:glutamate-5-semialdehyde dehydrogenase